MDYEVIIMKDNFKVILEIKDNLSDFQRREILKFIKTWSDKFFLFFPDGVVYVRKDADKVNLGDEFGSAFFYAVMLDKKEFFKKLEYYDFVAKEFDYAV